MLITKKINNNVAFAQTSAGEDVVVLGCGIGFPKIPYELDDESKIEHIYRKADSDGMYATIVNISDEVMASSAEIVDMAKDAFDCKLNPNLVISLADHLQFAIQRLSEGISLDNPLGAEVALVYPRETELGKMGLHIIEEHTGVKLPPCEAHSIALHLVSAESNTAGASGDMELVIKSTSAIEEATTIIERCIDIEIDRTSYNYARFVAHMRYLIARLMKGGKQDKSANSSLFHQVARDFPDVYACASQINAYLKGSNGWTCTNEELLYLMMHINRLRSSAES